VGWICAGRLSPVTTGRLGAARRLQEYPLARALVAALRGRGGGIRRPSVPRLERPGSAPPARAGDGNPDGALHRSPRSDRVGERRSRLGRESAPRRRRGSGG
jgi:hypothetical protein